MPTQTTTIPADTHLGRVAYRVNDVATMTEFYTTVVGLNVLDQSGDRTVLGIDTPCLVLDTDTDAPDRTAQETGLYHTAFRVPTRNALGNALNRIRTHWSLDGASDHGVSEALYCTDPEDNGVEIYRDYPREQWPVTDDGRVQMTTKPLDFDALDASTSSSSTAPTETRVGHIHLEVSSLDTFRELYVDTLGFPVRATVPNAVFIGAGGYHHHIGANTWHTRQTPHTGRGLEWFEIAVPEQDDYAQLRSQLNDWKGTVTETAETLIVTDADGNEVHITIDD